MLSESGTPNDPEWLKRLYIKTHSSDCPSVCPSVCHKNNNLLSVCHKNLSLAHIFWRINDRALIFGMHDPYDKSFLLVPFSDLLPTSRSNLLPGGGPQFFEFAVHLQIVQERNSAISTPKGQHNWLSMTLDEGDNFSSGISIKLPKISTFNVIIPPATKLGGYTGITLSICLSVCPSVCRRARG